MHIFARNRSTYYGGAAVQKKGKDRGRLILSSTPFLILLLLLGILLAWVATHDSTARDLSYTELMQICKADDANLRLRNVVFRRNGDVVGEMVVSDTVSDGTLTPQEPTQTVRFR